MLQFKNQLIQQVDENFYQSNRKKLLKIGLSALFPGLGHFYSGNYKIGAIYSTIEIVGWVGRENYLSKAEESSVAYKNFAKDHWSLARWFKDYFNPIGKTQEDAEAIEYWFTHVDSNGDGIYEEVPFRGPWDYSHGLYFYYNGNIVGTTGGEHSLFATEIYPAVCETSVEENFTCHADINDIKERVGDIVYDHHFFEGIGKYNVYLAGWDDEGYMENAFSDIAYTDNKKQYENTLRAIHKDNNNTANDFLSLLLINRAVSVIDIILRKSNKNLSISTASNYDMNNRYRINSINLSIGIN